jgi:hypothetical protein
MLAILERDMNSRPFIWCVQPLHMHRGIGLSHNVVTKIKKQRIHSKIDTQIAFHKGMTSKGQMYRFILH